MIARMISLRIKTLVYLVQVYLPGADYKGYGGGKIEWICGVINGQDGIGTKYEASAQPDKENKVVIDGQTIILREKTVAR